MKEFESGQAAYGFEGLCVKAYMSEANVRTLTLWGSTDEGKLLKEFVEPQFCIEVQAHVTKPRALFSFARTSLERKLSILGRYGATDVSCSAPFESPAPAKDFKPEGGHIQLWLVLLEQVFPRLVTYNPELLHILFSERVAHEDVEEEIAREKVRCEFRASVREAGRHLFPVHCPECAEHPNGHWTLLSLERETDSAEVSVRYFDTMNTMNEICLSRANQLLDWFGVEARAERTNTFRQAGEDCAWWVLHYAEVEARDAHSEGPGACLAIGNALRKPQIRQCLKAGCEQQEAARVKWLQEQEKAEAQAEAVRKIAEKSRGSFNSVEMS